MTSRKSLFVFAAASVLCAQNVSTGDPDSAAIRKVVARYVEAREHRDPAAIQSLFTAESDQLVSSGEWRKGRDAVVRGTMATSRRTGGTRSITVESVRLLSPAVAIADGRYDLSGLAGGTSRHMWTTLILVKSSGEWRIAAIRNMLPAPPEPAAK
ncbi:MAG TPA: SgcJ/EcaC family oxidoreductase [Bryobacteraceae bacterium]|jgi:uncharacterized protein (TIGR02246 family)